MSAIQELQSEIVKLQNQLAESEAKRQQYESLLDSLDVSIIRKDRQYRYIYANKPYLDSVGLTSIEELLGKDNYYYYPKEMADKYTADDEAVMSGGQLFEDIEAHRLPTTGEMIYVQVRKMPIRDEHGEVVGLQLAFWDVTATKRAEEERARMQHEIIEAQRLALKDLSTPIIPLLEGILVMPLIGSIDTARARDITRSLLAGITQYRAKIVILDITGVQIVDTGVADHLNKTIQAARLKGAKAIVTGISDAVAETIVDLGIDWTAMETLRDLQSGLMAALQMVNIDLVKR